MRNKLLILIIFAALFAPGMLRAQTIALKADTVSVPCQSMDTFLMPLRLYDFTNVAGLQFTFSWNTAHLDYAYITQINPAFLGIGFDTTSFINQGKFTFSWTNLGGGITLPDTTILLSVAFRRISGPFTLAEYVNTPTDIVAVDANGNDLIVQTRPGAVRPIDNQPPTILCPGDVSLQVPGPTAVNGIAPVALADNCPIQSVGWSSAGATSYPFTIDPDASGSIFNLGQSTVNYVITDAGGNTAACSFLVNLELLPSDSLTVIAGAASASCGQTVTVNISVLNFDSISGLQFSLGWDPALLGYASVGNFHPDLLLSVGNFGVSQTANGFLGFAWTSALPNGNTLPPGTTIFSVTLNVLANNAVNTGIQFGDFPTLQTAFSSANLPPEEIGFVTVNGQVNILDNQPPAITCPANVVVMADNGTTTATVNNLAPLALSDNCGGNVTLSYLQTGATPGQGQGNAGGVFNAGTTTVTYTAQDASNNTATCAFTVTVNAGTPLTLQLDTIATDCQASGAQIAIDLTVQDFTNIIGLQFDIVWNNLVLEFDSIGNVYPGLNLTPTMFFGFATVADGKLQFFGGNAGGWPTIPDDGTFITLYFTVLNANGATSINFSGIIDAVNSGFNSVPVNPINGAFSSIDLTPPVFTFCPPDTMVMTIGNECNVNVDITNPEISDACSGVAGATSNQPDNIYEIGQTLVIFTATDFAGNTAICSLTVTVNENNPPQLFDCPAGITVPLSGSGCQQAVSWPPPSASDACSQAQIDISSSATPGSLFDVGSTLVLYTATDANGNQASCSFLVVVQDTTAPVLQCPVNVTATATNNCAALVSFDFPIISDNCDQNLDVSSDGGSSGDIYPVGTTAVVFTASDDFNNTGTCSFNVVVTDSGLPVLNCPADLTVTAGPDSCGAIVQWSDPVVTDDCDSDITAITLTPPGSFFGIGVSVVSYLGLDASGNAGSCSFQVQVIETQPPVFPTGCPQVAPVLIPSNVCTATVSWQPPAVGDNCAFDTLLVSQPSGSMFNAGSSVVTYTALDASGNSATCTFTVTVVDPVPPQFISCPSDTVFTNVSPCGVLYNWAIPVATDNCDPTPSVISTRQPDQPFFAGITVVVIQAMDDSGNSDTCSFTVNVSSVQSPGFTGIPANITVECPGPVNWTPPVPVGFCGTPTLTSNYDPGDPFDFGTTTVIYTATDTSGVPTTVTFNITVAETVPPVFSCPTSPIAVNVYGQIDQDPSEFLIEASPANGCAGVSLEFDLPSATDNCGVPQVTQIVGDLSGSVFSPGLDTLIFRAVDSAGNQAFCPVIIRVAALPEQVPLVSPNPGCVGDTVTLSVGLPIPGATYTWQGPGNTSFDQPTWVLTNFSQGQAGTYTVTATINGCTTTPASVEVFRATVPDAVDDLDFTIDPGALDTFDVLDNDIFSPAFDYYICGLDEAPDAVTLLGDSLLLFQAGQDPGSISFFYTVCSRTCPNLTDMAAVTITVRDLECAFVPNIITPNGDDLNDYFEIPCLNTGLYPDNSLIVFNQWGDKVFEAAPYSNDPATAWRGTLQGENGRELPDGTYFYIFKPTANDPAIKGFVEIFR